ncbi:uncharacterized protein PGTG_13457 [Puccinia graminis f. sp. tritici CRL 75-36-700-3]|uniref:Uncharacterized protein n=1 Tax=Puccinia graminis f. sp. tritici (strain CRL 75-36-700-3 / race SCCL) TaxID=418459 RepID=E3KTX6_PUCGT|nr:uncharacterized protein PGTG_13457 [Puccinia graminis f. sp. tritici CRL 75-36-700-3]EFP87671.2 hypothetical protein PGTG_13457 [Puccinia graminis f. sp. tritici CRL 75-36-700-3]
MSGRTSAGGISPRRVAMRGAPGTPGAPCPVEVLPERRVHRAPSLWNNGVP